MSTTEQFWFWLGWALGDDQVAPEHTVKITEGITQLLENRLYSPDAFARYVVGWLSAANEARAGVLLTARKLAIWHGLPFGTDEEA